MVNQTISSSHESQIKATEGLSAADKHFIEQRDLILQDINQTMDSILNNLNGLNISLENSIAVGKEFESISELWKTFYDGLSTETDPVGPVAPATAETDESSDKSS